MVEVEATKKVLIRPAVARVLRGDHARDSLDDVARAKLGTGLERFPLGGASLALSAEPMAASRGPLTSISGRWLLGASGRWFQTAHRPAIGGAF